MPIRAGQVIEDPQWKQIDYLLSRGYISAEDGESADVVETSAVVDEFVDIEPELEEIDLTESLEEVDEIDPLEEVASIEAEPKQSRSKKK